MPLVRRLRGYAHRKAGDARRHEVERAVQRLRKQTETVGGNARYELDHRKQRRPEHRRHGGLLLGGVGKGGLFGGPAFLFFLFDPLQIGERRIVGMTVFHENHLLTMKFPVPKDRTPF